MYTYTRSGRYSKHDKFLAEHSSVVGHISASSPQNAQSTSRCTGSREAHSFISTPANSVRALVENATKRKAITAETVKIIELPCAKALSTSRTPLENRRQRKDRSSVAQDDNELSTSVCMDTTYMVQYVSTITQSSAFQALRKYAPSCLTNPCVMIRNTISAVKMTPHTKLMYDTSSI